MAALRTPLRLAFLAAVLAALLAACGIAPASAAAQGYACPRVSIQAQAETDGTLRVLEQRSFSFEGTCERVWWDLGNALRGDAKVRVRSVRMAHADAEGVPLGDWSTLQPVAFQLAWRTAGGPSGDAFSYDAAQERLYAFFEASDEGLVFELDYEVEDGVQAYDDVAEVYWRYVDGSWDADSSDVTLALRLPVPQGAEVVPGGNVRAWGHGPLDGTVSVEADGSVLCAEPAVRAGQYAEVRVVFPVSWLSSLDAEARAAHQGTTRLDAAIEEESAWADQAATQRMMGLMGVVAMALACAGALAVAVVLFRRFGREHEPSFTGEHWRSVPDPGLSPAIIGRLWRWDHESDQDLVASAMDLGRRGLLRVERGARPLPDGNAADDYLLVRTDLADAASQPIDQATLEALFGALGDGEGEVWVGALVEAAAADPKRCMGALDGWQERLGALVAEQGLFDERSQHLARALGVTAAAFALVGIAASLLTGNAVAALLMVPTAIALAVIANYLPRRTVRGNELAARSKALRNWLRDLPTLDEGSEAVERPWPELMEYAYLFGVEERALRGMLGTMPQEAGAHKGAPSAAAARAAAGDDAAAAREAIAWWEWCAASRGSSGRTMPPASEALEAALGQALSAAQRALAKGAGEPPDAGERARRPGPAS